MAPSDRKYNASHEWAQKEGDLVLVGITDVAVKRLSDLVYVELPAKGKKVAQGQVFGEIESVKAVSELISPVTGEIVDVNADLADHLDDLGSDPYGKGWMLKVRPTGDGGLPKLMDAAAYDQHAASEEH
jgi:glycine cleavage system H protein